MEFVDFSRELFGADFQNKRAVFDIAVASQKSSPFSKTAQNELAKELYAAGLFNPGAATPALVCLEMMDFEGKNAVISKVSANSRDYNVQKQLSEQNAKLTELVNRAYGTNLTPYSFGEVNHPGRGQIKSKKPRKQSLRDNYLGAERLKEIRKSLK